MSPYSNYHHHHLQTQSLKLNPKSLKLNKLLPNSLKLNAMDLSNTKTLDLETSTTPQFTKTLSFTKGTVLSLNSPQPMKEEVSYKECLKNHAVNIGGYSLDGCGEYMHASNSNPSDPKSLKCAACGCHRNFHRRETQDQRFLNFHTQQPWSSSPSSSPESPQPVQQAYFGLGPPPSHVLIAEGHKRKRSRTKFSKEQKERMYGFADKLGWKMQNCEEKVVEEFCEDIGVPRRVFKVWMHNHKNLVNKTATAAAAALANEGINVNGVCKREDFEGDNVDGSGGGHNGGSSSF